MAYVKFSSFVTEVRGSVGGSTFKKQKNGFSISNKSSGGSLSKLLENKQVPIMANIFKSWGYLPESKRQAWNYKATLFSFVNKYGNTVFLTGRQLYIKLHAQRSVLNLDPIDPNTISNGIEDLYLQNFVFSSNFGGQVTLSDECTSGYLVFRLRLVSSQASPVIYNRSKVFFVKTPYTSQVFDLGNELLSVYPFITVCQKVYLIMQVMNKSGFLSPPMSKFFIAT